MAYNYRDVVTGTVYAPADEEHVAYFEEWARFERTDDPATSIKVAGDAAAAAAVAEAEAAAAAAAEAEAAAARKGGK